MKLFTRNLGLNKIIKGQRRSNLQVVVYKIGLGGQDLILEKDDIE